MDFHPGDAEPFFGDIDILEESDGFAQRMDEAASIRTLIAERLSSTSNPLSVHDRHWQPRHSSSQETLVPPRLGVDDDGPSTWLTSGNPAPSYLDFRFPTVEATRATTDVARADASVDRGIDFARRAVEQALIDECVENDDREDGHQQTRFTQPLPRWADFMTEKDMRAVTETIDGRTSPYHFHGRPQDPPEPRVPTYILAPDKAMLETNMAFIDFLPDQPAKLASLVVITQEDGTFPVDGLDLDQLESQCPLLAMGFERNRAGCYKNSLETKSRIVAISFLRFLCTGSYLIDADDGVCLIPPSLLFHCCLFQLASFYDLPALMNQARANVMRITEFACSYPGPPEDLCDAARFVYAHLGKHTDLIESIQHYCVNCFQAHNLKDNFSFRQLVDELPLFGLDLLKTNIERGFADDGAADIIQLPIRTAPLQVQQVAVVDFIYDIWGPNTFALRCGYDSSASSTPSSPRLQGYALVRRPKSKVTSDSNYDSSASDAEGFTLVHRPRPIQRSDVIDSADEADTSDWSDAACSDHEGLSTKRKGKFTAIPDRRPDTSQPPQRSQTPTQLNPYPDDLFDSSDADFTVVKRRKQPERNPDDSDEFEML